MAERWMLEDYDESRQCHLTLLMKHEMMINLQ